MTQQFYSCVCLRTCKPVLGCLSCFAPNSPRLETTQAALTGWVSEQTVVHPQPCHGNLPRNKKEPTTDRRNKLHEPLGNSEVERARLQGDIACPPLYVTLLNCQSHRNGQSVLIGGSVREPCGGHNPPREGHFRHRLVTLHSALCALCTLCIDFCKLLPWRETQ